ncbi:Divalent-cation tolerance protein CutA [Alphaproteobacteria bacterium SO-S41]|nr:Divalent-cation tolerance protein CutA [Alphaproteobacteria bacterium SO-S41]
MKQNDDLVFIYTTLPDQESAVTIAHALVERRLAACCNIGAPIRSIYSWDGAIEEASEIPVLIKTRRTLVAEAVDAAHALHPHEAPCFVRVPIDGVSEFYLEWALSVTKG